MPDRDVTRGPTPLSGVERSRPTLGVRLMGALGAGVIAAALLGARLWARVTRSPYYRD